MAGQALATLGPWGLLILVVATVLTAFIRGGLVSSNQVARLEKSWEKQVNEAARRESEWKTAYELAERRADLLTDQLEKLMSYAQTTDQLIRSLPPGRTT